MGDSARLLRETAGPTADPEADEIIENVSYGALAARAAACERPPSPVLELNLKYRIKFRADTSDTFPACSSLTLRHWRPHTRPVVTQSVLAV